MSEAYQRELQNNALLESLTQKTAALKSVTVDIYDNARNQGMLEDTVDTFSHMQTSIKGSAGRLTRMAQQGDKVAIMKVAAIVGGTGLGVWVVLGWIF